MNELHAAHPDNVSISLTLVHALIEKGDVLRAERNVDAARQAYEEGAELVIEAGRYTANTRLSLAMLRAVGASKQRSGEVLMAQGNLADALKPYQSNLAIRERLAIRLPEEVRDRARYELATAHVQLASVLKAQHRAGDALKTYRDGLTIMTPLAEAKPKNAEWQRSLSNLHIQMGSLQLENGDLSEASQSLQSGLTIAKRLAIADEDNANWQHGLANALARMGAAQMAQGNFAEAHNAFAESRAIVVRLAKIDETNTQRQYDVGVAEINVGNVLAAQGKPAEAKQSFDNARLDFESLVKTDSDNANWQRALANAQARLGDMTLAEGDLTGALELYLASERTARRASPSRFDRYRDAAVFQKRMGDVRFAQGALEKALKHYRNEQIVWTRQTVINTDDAGTKEALANSHIHIARVLAKQGEPGQALDELGKARDLLVALGDKYADSRSFSEALAKNLRRLDAITTQIKQDGPTAPRSEESERAAQ